MTYYDALKDGIRHSDANVSHRRFYYPLCHICGKEVASPCYNPNIKYTCRECKVDKRRKKVDRHV